MSEITLNAEVRTELGKKAHALRRNGKVPGIYYGHGQKNIPISIPEPVLRPLYATSAARIINLKLNNGSSYMCILRDVQFDPVTDRPVHFDLYGLNENEELTIEVPVRLVGGTPKGVKDGGILQHVLHKIKVSCLPKDIPSHIEIDVANLEINRSIHVKDITIPNVKFVENENSTIVGVVPPTVVKEEAVAAAPAAEAPAEPEVIGKGKKAEEGTEEEKEVKETKESKEEKK